MLWGILDSQNQILPTVEKQEKPHSGSGFYSSGIGNMCAVRDKLRCVLDETRGIKLCCFLFGITGCQQAGLKVLFRMDENQFLIVSQIWIRRDSKNNKRKKRRQSRSHATFLEQNGEKNVFVNFMQSPNQLCLLYLSEPISSVI